MFTEMQRPKKALGQMSNLFGNAFDDDIDKN